MFVFSGDHKLLDLPGTVKMFEGMSMPDWFAGLIGGAEALADIGLLVPRPMRLTAPSFMIIVLGAVFMRAIKIPGGRAKGGPTIAALLLLVVVLVLRSRTGGCAV